MPESQIVTNAILSINSNNPLSVPMGKVDGITSVNKYGKADDGVQLTPTDIWDRADSSATQQIWLAPTEARIHTIASSSVNDTTGGTGCDTVIVSYLKDWDTKEKTETITGNLNAGIAMSESAVIIHRMRIVSQSTSTTPNAGNITATASVDGTITAQINIGAGQTNMAIYGIPSTQCAYISYYEVNSHNTGNPSSVMETDFEILVNESPDVNEKIFINKSNKGLIVTGTSDAVRQYNPYFKVTGPAIIKFQAISTLADSEGSAEFDMYLVDNG